MTDYYGQQFSCMGSILFTQFHRSHLLWREFYNIRCRRASFNIYHRQRSGKFHEQFPVVNRAVDTRTTGRITLSIAYCLFCTLIISQVYLPGFLVQKFNPATRKKKVNSILFYEQFYIVFRSKITIRHTTTSSGRGKEVACSSIGQTFFFSNDK